MPSDYCSSDSDLGFEVEMARLDAEAEMLKYFFEHCPDEEYYIPRVVVYHPCMDKQPTPLTRVAVALFDDFDLRWHTEREYRVYDWVDAQVRLEDHEEEVKVDDSNRLEQAAAEAIADDK
ncbi:MAG: hypothetical protein Q9200_000791 [Gallowayella weberi]